MLNGISTEEIGEALVKLEIAREHLGHKKIASTLRYCHGRNDEAFCFVKNIILRESGKRIEEQ